MAIAIKEKGMQLVEKAITGKELKKRLNSFDSAKIFDVKIKEVKKRIKDTAKAKKEEEQREKALQALLNFKPLKGTNPKSVVDILREIRENE